ncbi:MAG TPA: hypothetical protein VJ624_01025 [Thermodesulfobacteriota bacterium]|nr:hypothetical protein [Thermodesulfobacteriota bacterium]
MKTKVSGFVVMLTALLLVVPVMADGPGISIGEVDGNIMQDMKNISITVPGVTLDVTKGVQYGDAYGFISGGRKDQVSVQMEQGQQVSHFQEQYTDNYSSAIGGQVDQYMGLSGELRRSGEFDLSAFSVERTKVLLEHDGNQMNSLIKSETTEGFIGMINGTGELNVDLSTVKYQGYYQEAVNPNTYSLHFGQLEESVNLEGSLKVRECDPYIGGVAFANTSGKTMTDAYVTPSVNSAIASQTVSSTAGIIGGKGITGEIDVNMITGYQQSSVNSTSNINQYGVTTISIDISKKSHR